MAAPLLLLAVAAFSQGRDAAPAASDTNAATGGAAAAVASTPTTTVTHGQFVDIPVFRPSGKVQQFVLLLSGNDTPSPSDRELARTMAGKGALVALVALPPFYERIAAESAKCVYAGGAVENFARYVQALEKVPGYIEPLVVGTGDGGGTFAHALAVQAPADNFSGVLSLGFCPRLTLKMPLCTGNALQFRGSSDASGVDLASTHTLPSPWTVLQTDGKAACSASAQAFVQRVPHATWVPRAADEGRADIPPGFDAAYAQLASRRVAVDAPPAQLADLPVVEAPLVGTTGNASMADRFAVLVSGDGGWADIDKRIAAALVKDGVPVAGFDSLRYFWTQRTPEMVAADLDRVIRYYASRWKRSEVILIGYSQGADVIPFALNRMPQATRDSIKLNVLLGPGQKAAFEFHVTNWIGKSGDRPILPEAKKMQAADTLCFYGTDEKADSLCPAMEPANAKVIAMPGGHHMGGDYEALAARMLQALPAK